MSEYPISGQFPRVRAPLWVVDAGEIDYDMAVALQERIRAARLDDAVPDVLLVLQHPPVITLGRGARREHLLAQDDQLLSAGVSVRECARGGDITYHGPGQLVGYPILSLVDHGKDVHRYVRDLEETLIRALAKFEIEARCVRGMTGVWVGDAKVAAIGVGVKHWVTWHGFALNIEPDLSAFNWIVPCGIRDRSVTSMAQLLEGPIDFASVTRAVIESFCEVFQFEPEMRGISQIPLA